MERIMGAHVTAGGGEARLLKRVWAEGLMLMMADAAIRPRLILESEGAFSNSHRALWRMSSRSARHDIKAKICSSFLVLLYCEMAKEPKCVWDNRQRPIRRARKLALDLISCQP